MRKTLVALLILGMSVAAYANFRGFSRSGANLGAMTDIACSYGVFCSKTSGKFTVKTSNQVNPTTGDTLTAAQCGSTIINTSGISINLPEASTVLGCEYRFVVGHTGGLWINPDDADQILLLTNAAGDTIWADAKGESVVLEATSSSEWSQIGADEGTWTDGN